MGCARQRCQLGQEVSGGRTFYRGRHIGQADYPMVTILSHTDGMILCLHIGVYCHILVFIDSHNWYLLAPISQADYPIVTILCHVYSASTSLYIRHILLLIGKHILVLIDTHTHNWYLLTHIIQADYSMVTRLYHILPSHWSIYRCMFLLILTYLCQRYHIFK